jgi:two-component system, LuxR family, sensor histidine kinase DctS
MSIAGTARPIGWMSLWPTRRGVLWALLVALVLALLVTLVWLAGRYEASQVQSRLERDTADASSDIRAALTRNVQNLQALQSQQQASAWAQEASTVLREHREMVRIEWRDAQLNLLAAVDSPYQKPLFDRLARSATQSDVQIVCGVAKRLSGAAYSSSHFVPQPDGLGLELIEMCMPTNTAGPGSGYLVATYALGSMLVELVGKQLARGQEISFTEADGTRLAIHGTSQRSSRVFTAQHLLDLPGNTMVLRMDSWRGAPDLFPNVLTALVTFMSVALVSVLVLLGKDISKRLRAERELAEALAFRKAMEDSLVTGLRARDLQGNITYVNPAFCEMTGFTPAQLMGATAPMPYWPPELADEYQQRQAVRLAGNVTSRQGYESVFVRKDGMRFPVLIIEAPLINVLGVQTGWMSAILDVTDQRRMEELSRSSQERLQASARLATVGEMASLLSHELNQPLAAISSYATGSINMLQANTSLSPQDVEHAMRRIGEQAERAGKVIKSVHDFVRRRDQARETVAPAALFDAVMPLISLQARKLGVRVQLQCASGLAAVHCDRTMVEQVLLNLARNAMQAMENTPLPERVLELQANATSRLSAQADKAPAMRWIEFIVSDQGAGIDASTAAQLFTPFFTTKQEGMGLGLSMCRTVVEQHGGFLAFEPRKPRGTVFKFTLPTYLPDALNATAYTAANAAGQNATTSALLLPL